MGRLGIGPSHRRDSPVDFLAFLTKKPAFFSWLTTHNRAFCSQQSTFTPRRQVILSTISPSTCRFYQLGKDTDLDICLKLLTFLGSVPSWQTALRKVAILSSSLSGGKSRVCSLVAFKFLFMSLIIISYHLRTIQPVCWVKTIIVQWAARSSYLIHPSFSHLALSPLHSTEAHWRQPVLESASRSSLSYSRAFVCTHLPMSALEVSFSHLFGSQLRSYFLKLEEDLAFSARIKDS